MRKTIIHFGVGAFALPFTILAWFRAIAWVSGVEYSPDTATLGASISAAIAITVFAVAAGRAYGEARARGE